MDTPTRGPYPFRDHRTLAELAALPDSQAELGPALPSRLAVYHQACETLVLARIAADLALPGRRLDLPRAARQLDKIRALLGPLRAMDSNGGGHG